MGVRAVALVSLAVLSVCASGAAGKVTAVPGAGHGADPASIDWLGELPGPAGGPTGRPLTGRARDDASALDVRAAEPELWCGLSSASDNTESEVDNGNPKIHAIYAVASDAPDRLQVLGGQLQTDAFQASALIEQLYQRALRFDMGTSCGPQYLDISDVRLSKTTAQLAAAVANDTLLDILRDELRAAGYAVGGPTDSVSAARPRRFNFVIWLDGPQIDGLCGQASLYPDERDIADNLNAFGGKLAVVFRDGATFCASNALRHEVGHTLGALMPRAPHAFDGAHCNDAYEDTMCYPEAPPRAGGAFGAQFFDYGNDDYWALPGQSLGHWTVDRSPFVCPDVSCNVPGGAVTTSSLDSDGDGDTVPDAIDRCPGIGDPHGLDPTAAVGCGAARDATPQGSAPQSRTAATKRKVTIRVRRRATYRIAVRCGRRTLARRTVRGPRRLVLRVRCSTRPQVKITRLAKRHR
jgi:hypothetical protein